MRFAEYLERIEPKFTKNFDIQRDIDVEGVKVDFYADFREIIGRTFLTKYDVLDKYEICERCYLKHFTDCTREEIDAYFALIAGQAAALRPEAYHMSTDFTAVMAFDAFDPSLAGYVAGLRYGRLYHWYFRGWGDVKLICVDLSTGGAATNRIARRDKKLYRIPQR